MWCSFDRNCQSTVLCSFTGASSCVFRRTVLMVIDGMQNCPLLYINLTMRAITTKALPFLGLGINSWRSVGIAPANGSNPSTSLYWDLLRRLLPLVLSKVDHNRLERFETQIKVNTCPDLRWTHIVPKLNNSRVNSICQSLQINPSKSC